MTTDTADELPDFNLAGPLPSGMTVLEASAGTGKTYSLTALVARFIAERDVTTDQVLMVTFTRAAAREMKDRTRQRLLEVLHHLDGSVPADDPWITAIADCDGDEHARRLQRIRAAVSTIDAAAITTIHGFCQQALREIGVSGGDIAVGDIDDADSSALQAIVRDELLRVMGDDPLFLGESFKSKNAKRTPRDIEDMMLKVVAALATNAGSVAAPTAECDDEIAQRWATFARNVMEKVEAARIASGHLSFDDLISGMERASKVRAVVDRMRRQYRVVLIDEFQDTDTAQWGIFRRLFLDPPSSSTSPVVVCVGDPKQAIYRFRGADIAAYVDAVSLPGVVKYKMATNWRTDRQLVHAMNALMRDLDLGEGVIRYVQVEAATKNDQPGLRDAGVPLQVRWVAKDGADITVGDARPAIAVDLANHVVSLLDNSTIRRGTDFASVRPGDIAVLVRGHAEAEHVVEALAARDIPAVRSKLGTVVETPAMTQLRVLAAAIADPANARLARSLVLTWFVDLPHSAVLDDAVVEQLQARCAAWGSVLERSGAAGFLGALRTDAAVLEALARADLERRLTDIEHILELVQAETKGASLHRTHLVRVLDTLAADTTDSDARTRRTDTDADAVQITTMHSSKGLEYPIVLVPYAKELRIDKPYVFGAPDATGSHRRHVDAAPWWDWSEGDLTPDTRKSRTADETADDERRLIYVALTRAKHQVIVWWAGTKGVEKGSLAQVLFRDATGARILAPSDNNDLEAYFTELVGRIGAPCAVARLSTSVEPIERVGGSPEALPLLTNAEWTRGELRRAEWYRWSFSSLMASDLAPTHDRLRGGNDEGDAGGDADDSDAPALDSAFHAPLLGLPAHAEFGTLVHELMERSDFTRPDRAEHLLELIRSDGRVEALEIDPVALRDGLDALIATPLHGLFDNTRLADIPTVDWLAEMDFHFPILDTHGSLLRTEIARIAALDTASPYHDYFTRLSAGWTTERIGGLMTGSIDAVLRVGSRYAVVDYKSNRLHTPGDTATNGNYSGAALLQAMESHDYPMQALLYSVALHRFLSMRLPGYDPDVHHAGSGYLFVRGMTGADTPVINGQVRGLSAWRPSTAVLRRLDALFAGKELVA